MVGMHTRRSREGSLTGCQRDSGLEDQRRRRKNKVKCSCGRPSSPVKHPVGARNDPILAVIRSLQEDYEASKLLGYFRSILTVSELDSVSDEL